MSLNDRFLKPNTKPVMSARGRKGLLHCNIIVAPSKRVLLSFK
jgi:hypothetical protein